MISVENTKERNSSFAWRIAIIRYTVTINGHEPGNPLALSHGLVTDCLSVGLCRALSACRTECRTSVENCRS